MAGPVPITTDRTLDIVMSIMRHWLEESSIYAREEIFTRLQIRHYDYEQTRLHVQIERLILAFKACFFDETQDVLDNHARDLIVFLKKESTIAQLIAAFKNIVRGWLVQDNTPNSWVKIVKLMHFTRGLLDGSLVEEYNVPIQNATNLVRICADVIMQNFSQWMQSNGEWTEFVKIAPQLILQIRQEQQKAQQENSSSSSSSSSASTTQKSSSPTSTAQKSSSPASSSPAQKTMQSGASNIADPSTRVKPPKQAPSRPATQYTPYQPSSASSPQKSGFVRHISTPQKPPRSLPSSSVKSAAKSAKTSKSAYPGVSSSTESGSSGPLASSTLKHTTPDASAHSSTQPGPSTALPTSQDAGDPVSEETHDILRCYLKERILTSNQVDNALDFLLPHLDTLFPNSPCKKSNEPVVCALKSLAGTIMPAIADSYNEVLMAHTEPLAVITDIESDLAQAKYYFDVLAFYWLVEDGSPVSYERITVLLELVSEMIYRVSTQSKEAGLSRIDDIISMMEHFINQFCEKKFQEMGGWNYLVENCEEIRASKDYYIPTFFFLPELPAELKALPNLDVVRERIQLEARRRYVSCEEFEFTSEEAEHFGLPLEDVEQIKEEFLKEYVAKLKRKQRMEAGERRRQRNQIPGDPRLMDRQYIPNYQTGDADLDDVFD